MRTCRQPQLRHGHIGIFFQRKRLKRAKPQRRGGIHRIAAHSAHQLMYAFAHRAVCPAGILAHRARKGERQLRRQRRICRQQRLCGRVGVRGLCQCRDHFGPRRAGGCQARRLNAGSHALLVQLPQLRVCLLGLLPGGAQSRYGALPAACHGSQRAAVQFFALHGVSPSLPGVFGIRGARRSPPPKMLCVAAGSAARTFSARRALSSMTSRTVR